MIKKISESGMTDREIAVSLSTDDDHVSQSIVTRWKNGVIKKTDYSRFLRISNLHHTILGKVA